ncbi:MAG: TNT domain-containing protein [Sporichthyaceae bacterium]
MGGWRYPTDPPDGFAGPSRSHGLQPGDAIDRFGDADGKFASPGGTSFDQRALPPSSVGSDYTQWRVLKPLPDSILEGDVAPWFEQPGGGVQYKFDHELTWYEKNGYLERITPQ